MVHSTPKPKTEHVQARVTDVLPATGLKFLTGAAGQLWTIKRGTPGSGLRALTPGGQVILTVLQNERFASTSALSPFD